jgi:hypothetical protein
MQRMLGALSGGRMGRGVKLSTPTGAEVKVYKYTPPYALHTYIAFHRFHKLVR